METPRPARRWSRAAGGSQGRDARRRAVIRGFHRRPWDPEAPSRVFRRAGRLDSVSVVKRLSAVRGGEYACQRGLQITYGSAAPEP